MVSGLSSFVACLLPAVSSARSSVPAFRRSAVLLPRALSIKQRDRERGDYVGLPVSARLATTREAGRSGSRPRALSTRTRLLISPIVGLAHHHTRHSVIN